MRVIERLDTQRIAREKQERRLCKTSSQIKHGKGKHAAQFLGTLFFPFFPGVRDGFRVRLRGEGMAQSQQARPQLAVVVDFAVEDDGYVVCLIPNGLAAADKVDDAQPAHAERYAGCARLFDQVSFIVGAAVAHGCGHRAHAGFSLRGMCCRDGAANPAHAFT